MTRLTLVRHAQPGASWDEALDPGLGSDGRAQAEAVAASLGAGSPRRLVTSPLLRARETAAPLAAAWGVEPVVDATVGEIPSPPELVDAERRSQWLGATLAGLWSDAGKPLREWRTTLLATLSSFDLDTVVVTHFVAINAAVGAARGDDRIISCTPDVASLTELEVYGGTVTLVELGRQAETRIR